MGGYARRLLLEILTFAFTFLTFKDYVERRHRPPLIMAIYKEGTLRARPVVAISN